MTNLISTRLKIARENSGLTQSELAKRLGFKDRQTITAIESGQRKMSAEELLKTINIFGVDVDYFSDPFRLVGEGQFSWRAATDADSIHLNQFEEQAGRWIATYRYLSKLQGDSISPLQSRLSLNIKSSFEDARAAAESLIIEWELGEIPALRLESSIKANLNSLVMYVDSPDQISGAACQMIDMNCILINRNQAEGRRNYNLAHELFHLLTWEQMPPQYTDMEFGNKRTGKTKRTEQLANNFASALLMPEKSLKTRWEKRENKDIHKWLNEAACKFLVTAQAVKWRIVHLGWFSSEALDQINNEYLVNNGRPLDEQKRPSLFCIEFVKKIYFGIDKGQLSVRKTAELLGLLLNELEDLFRSYDLPALYKT